MFLGEKKGLGRSMRFVQSETKSSFSPTPSGKATWPEPRNTFRKTNVKGRDQRRPSLLPLGCSSRPHATATHQAEGAGRQRTATQEPRWEHPFLLPLGKQKNFSIFGEYFRNSNERDLFLLLAHGAEKGLLSSWVWQNTGTPERLTFLRLAAPRPRPAHPGWSSRSISHAQPAALAPRGAHPTSPRLED